MISSDSEIEDVPQNSYLKMKTKIPDIYNKSKKIKVKGFDRLSPKINRSRTKIARIPLKKTTGTDLHIINEDEGTSHVMNINPL